MSQAKTPPEAFLLGSKFIALSVLILVSQDAHGDEHFHQTSRITSKNITKHILCLIALTPTDSQTMW